MKYMIALFLLSALLLAGCSEEPVFPSESSASLTVSLQNTSYPASSAEDASSVEQNSSEIVLPPEPLSLPGGIIFTFPENWESLPNGMELNAVSADRTLSVTASFTPDSGAVTLTPALLEANVFPELVNAWESYGMADVAGEMETCLLAHWECPAVFLQGVYDGMSVFQKQVYLFLEGGYLTVTVTSYETDQTDYLLTLFA